MLLQAAQRAVSGFLLITTLVAVYILLTPAKVDDWFINPLTGLTAIAFSLLAVSRVSFGAPSRLARWIWLGLIAVFGVVALLQFVEPYAETLNHRFGIDDVADCALLALGPVALWMISRFDPPPILARQLFLVGLLLQFGATVLDVGNAVLSTHWRRDVVLIDAATDFGQFAALQLYLVGIAVFVISLHYHRRSRAGGVRQLGDLSRYLLARLNLFDRGADASCRPGAGARLWLLRLLVWVPSMAKETQARSGKNVWRQLGEIVQLTWRHGLDAKAYYNFRLYGLPGFRRTAGYLTGFEANGGLFRAIDDLLVSPGIPVAVDFTDRQAVLAWCRRHRLAAVEAGSESECHPALRRLAGADTAIVLRVITCRTRQGELQVTHAVLRLTGRMGTDSAGEAVELIAPVGLADGRLGALSSSQRPLALARDDRHPMGAARLLGETVPFWDAARSLALAAHRQCGDCFIIGWDIACTATGPVIVNATCRPDVEMLQCAYDAAISDSPLGPVLLEYLQVLNVQPRKRPPRGRP